MKRDVRSVKNKLEDLDEYVDRKTVVDLIHEIVPILINEKSKSSFYLFESFKEFDLVEIIEVREKKAILHKQ